MKYLTRYIVNYDDKSTPRRLKELGDIKFSSKVLNMVILETYKEKDIIKQVLGVISVTQTIAYGHKR